MRQLVKSCFESVITSSGATAVALAVRRGATLVLAYHGIVPEGGAAAGDLSLHLRRARFAEQLDELMRTHEIVPLGDLAREHARARPRAIITFDDAYRGTLEVGLPELVRRGLPATVFVAPAFVGGKDFWWDVLGVEEGLVPAVRNHALESLAGRDAAVREWAVARGVELQSVPEHQKCATEEQLRWAAAQPGITLASHTWGHPNLTALDEGEIERELVSSLEWLRARFPAVLPWLAYPYGLTSPRVEDVARRVGYEGAVLVSGGYGRPGATDPFRTPRLNIPAGLSLRGFAIRTSGLLNR